MKTFIYCLLHPHFFYVVFSSNNIQLSRTFPDHVSHPKLISIKCTSKTRLTQNDVLFFFYIVYLVQMTIFSLSFSLTDSVCARMLWCKESQTINTILAWFLRGLYLKHFHIKPPDIKPSHQCACKNVCTCIGESSSLALPYIWNNSITPETGAYLWTVLDIKATTDKYKISCLHPISWWAVQM